MKESWRKRLKSIDWNELAKCVLLALLPFVCCLIHCAVRGKTLQQVYLPGCEWNDELFYYKQTESILKMGYPRGFYGFNESHALKLSFAAWSPVLLLPFLLYGGIFGWNLMSPIYCNLLFFGITMAVFVKLTKPTWKQCALLGMMFVSFTPFVRYLFSTMPEITCFCMAILYLSVLYAYLQKHTAAKLTALFVLAILMTWMRPYLLLFLLLPCLFLVRKKRILGGIGAAVLLAGTCVVYYLLNHHLGAPYFTPLFKTDFIAPFLQGHFLSGIRGILVKLYYEGKTFVALTTQGMISGLAEGAYFACFVLLLFILMCQSVSDLLHKRIRQAILNGYLAFCFFAMWLALLLMYKMKEGSKHLLTFIAVGIFAVCLMKTRYYKKAILLSVLFCYLFFVRGDQPVDYGIPFMQEDRKLQLETWETIFANHLQLNEGTEPSYENTVIWCFSDGEVLTDWQVLYALPEGFGISCCYGDYVLEQLGGLHSRYLLIPAEGKLQRACEDAGLTLVGSDASVCLYDTRNPYRAFHETYDPQIEELNQGSYEAVCICMGVQPQDREVFTVYRGQNTYCVEPAVRTTGDLQRLLSAIRNPNLTDLYCYADPYMLQKSDISGEASLEDLFAPLRERYPQMRQTLLCYAPSLKEWQNTEKESAVSAYEKTIREAADLGMAVYFPGDCEWLTENLSNYREEDGIESYIEELNRHLLISMICDGRFRVTAENQEQVLEAFQNLVRYGADSDSYRAAYRKAYRANGKDTEEAWIFLGDSIFGNYTGSLSIPGVIRELGGIETVNCGYGGVCLTGEIQNEGEMPQAISGLDMIRALVSGSNAGLPETVPAYEGVQIAHDLQKKRVYLISFGINDFIQGKPLTAAGKDENGAEEETADPENGAGGDYRSALHLALQLLRDYDPEGEIILCTPTHISTFDGGNACQGPYGATLSEYARMVTEVGRQEQVRVLNLYESLPFAAESEIYLADGVHPNEKGRYVMAQEILQEMLVR